MEIVDQVSAEVVEETANKEQPCLGFKSMSNFFLHKQTSVASEYSHGLAGPPCSVVAEMPKTLPLDGHKQWRVRINRLTIKSNASPSLLLLTDTSGRTSSDAVAHFEQTGMGPHYIIHKDGHITQLVEEHLAAWCGNPGFWGTLPGRAEIPAGGFVNKVHYFAVSIALEGDGMSEGFDARQYSSLVPLAKEVSKRYGIHPWDVLGLSEICMPPGKSRAPGAHFDWSHLVDAGVTFGSPDPDTAALEASGSDQDLRELMQTWGYCLGGSDSDFTDRRQSFCDRYQRHDSACHPSFPLPALHALLRQRAATQAVR